MLTETKKRKKRLRARQRNRNIIRHIRTIMSCAICGDNFFNFYLDFHHIKSKTKKYNVGSMSKVRKHTLLREIKKCVIVCVRCHNLIHQNKIETVLKPIDPTHMEYPSLEN